MLFQTSASRASDLASPTGEVIVVQVHVGFAAKSASPSHVNAPVTLSRETSCKDLLRTRYLLFACIPFHRFICFSRIVMSRAASGLRCVTSLTRDRLRRVPSSLRHIHPLAADWSSPPSISSLVPIVIEQTVSLRIWIADMCLLTLYRAGENGAMTYSQDCSGRE